MKNEKNKEIKTLNQGNEHNPMHSNTDSQNHDYMHSNIDNQSHDFMHMQTDSHSHSHSHVHDPADKKKRLARISKIIGHLEHVKQMIENDDDCSDILMQISAVKSALNGLGKTIINEHMAHCIVHAIESGDSEAVEEFQEAIQKYL